MTWLLFSCVAALLLRFACRDMCIPILYPYIQTLCATSLLAYSTLHIWGAQSRGLAPPRNRHDAADRIVQAACDGSRDTRHQIPKPGARLSRCSWLRQ